MTLRLGMLWWMLALLSLAWPGVAQTDGDGDAPAADEPGFVVIINAANPETEMEAGRVSKMFLKKIRRWPDDVPVNPVDLNEKSPTRELFTETIHKKRVSAIKTFWQRMIFSGRNVPPAELNTDEEVIQFVLSDPGAIGYVSSATELPDGVKGLEIIDE